MRLAGVIRKFVQICVWIAKIWHVARTQEVQFLVPQVENCQKFNCVPMNRSNQCCHLQRKLPKQNKSVLTCPSIFCSCHVRIQKYRVVITPLGFIFLINVGVA